MYNSILVVIHCGSMRIRFNCYKSLLEILSYKEKLDNIAKLKNETNNWNKWNTAMRLFK